MKYEMIFVILFSKKLHLKTVMKCFVYCFFQRLQEDFDRHREFLETLKTRGQDLKSKIKQGNLYVFPKLTKLERKFTDFATALNQRQERYRYVYLLYVKRESPFYMPLSVVYLSPFFVYLLFSLKTKTSSWLEFCDKLQILDERLQESEKQAYSTRYCDTKEHYRSLQV